MHIYDELFKVALLLIHFVAKFGIKIVLPEKWGDDAVGLASPRGELGGDWDPLGGRSPTRLDPPADEGPGEQTTDLTKSSK